MGVVANTIKVCVKAFHCCFLYHSGLWSWLPSLEPTACKRTGGIGVTHLYPPLPPRHSGWGMKLLCISHSEYDSYQKPTHNGYCYLLFAIILTLLYGCSYVIFFVLFCSYELVDLDESQEPHVDTPADPEERHSHPMSVC